MANALHGREDRATRCPVCQKAALELLRVGPKRIVEREALPLVVTEDERRQMLCEKPEQWGVKRGFHPTVRRTALKHEVVEEEANYRMEVETHLANMGLVAALSTQAQCAGLDTFLRMANGEHGPVDRWFTSRLLADSTQRTGGTVGLLASEYRSVAECCGSHNTALWSATERAEAVSYVCHRMVDMQVWPAKLCGKLLRPAHN